MSEITKIGLDVLKVLFFAGAAGSALVVLLSGIEDVRSVFEQEPEETD